MNYLSIVAIAVLLTLAASCQKDSESGTNPRVFQARGVIVQLKPDGMTAVIKHEAVSN